jgi:hypothetical protein
VIAVALPLRLAIYLAIVSAGVNLVMAVVAISGQVLGWWKWLHQLREQHQETVARLDAQDDTAHAHGAMLAAIGEKVGVPGVPVGELR